MGWGILGVSLLGLFLGFVVVQEMFVQRHWRGLVNRGDRWAIRELVEQEIERWREMRTPKGTSASIWHGIQTTEVANVGRDFINLISSAEGEYRVVEGRRTEVSSPLDEGMKLAAALLERLFYDVPNVSLSVVRVDVYTTFRGEDGAPDQQCILSTVGERSVADRLPWDELRPNEIISRFESRFRLGENGALTPIDPGPVLREEDDEDGAENEIPQRLSTPTESAVASKDSTPAAYPQDRRRQD